MNKSTAAASLLAAALVALPLVAGAKLPAPTPEAKAKADETKNKAAWTDKVAAYKLCQSQDRVAAQYFKTAGKEPKAAGTPPCTDPGPYAPMAAASAPPLEAAGAHSPPKTATAPPSEKATHAEQTGAAKK